MRVRALETVFLHTRIYRKGDVFDLLGNTLPSESYERVEDSEAVTDPGSAPVAGAAPAKPRRRARVAAEVFPLPGAADSKLAQMME